MADILYRGINGLLDVAKLQMRKKSGHNSPTIRPKAGQLWNAGGMAMPVNILQLDRTLTNAHTNRFNYGFNALTPVITLSAITKDGIVHRFVTNNTGILRIDPNVSNNIVYSGGAMTNGEFLDVGNSSSLFIISSGSSWVAFRESGTLTEETP